MEKDNDQILMNQLNDLTVAIGEIKKTDGLLYLTDTMKTSLVTGIKDLYSDIAIKAFHYFKVNDFEPTERIIKLMRKIVSIALEKGVA